MRTVRGSLPAAIPYRRRAAEGHRDPLLLVGNPADPQLQALRSRFSQAIVLQAAEDVRALNAGRAVLVWHPSLEEGTRRAIWAELQLLNPLVHFEFRDPETLRKEAG